MKFIKGIVLAAILTIATALVVSCLSKKEEAVAPNTEGHSVEKLPEKAEKAKDKEEK